MTFTSLFGGIGKSLANPQYRLFWCTNALSTIGRWVFRTAIGWLVWKLTHDPKWLGFAAFANIFPMVVLSIFSGAISDRIGYVKVIRAMQLCMCLTGVVFSTAIYAGYLSVHLVIGVSALLGIVDAISTPPRISIVNALVTREELSAAIALGSAMFNVTRVLGPAIGGSLLLWTDPGMVIVIATLAFIQFYVALFFLRAKDAGGQGKLSWELLADMRDGVAYAWGHTGIRFVLLMLTAVGLLIRPVMEFMPGFASEVFHRGAGAYATLLSAIGAGALVASLWLAWRGRTEGLTPLVVASLAVQGITVVMFALSPNFYAGAAFLVVMGFFMLVGGVGSQTLIQNAVESAMRARTMSLFILLSWGLPAVGALVMGWIASATSLPPTIATGAALTLLVWLWARPVGGRLAPSLEQGGEAARVGAA